jgi:hypothetical protein
MMMKPCAKARHTRRHRRRCTSHSALRTQHQSTPPPLKPEDAKLQNSFSLLRVEQHQQAKTDITERIANCKDQLRSLSKNFKAAPAPSQQTPPLFEEQSRPKSPTMTSATDDPNAEQMWSTARGKESEQQNSLTDEGKTSHQTRDSLRVPRYPMAEGNNDVPPSTTYLTATRWQSALTAATSSRFSTRFSVSGTLQNGRTDLAEPHESNTSQPQQVSARHTGERSCEYSNTLSVPAPSLCDSLQPPPAHHCRLWSTVRFRLGNRRKHPQICQRRDLLPRRIPCGVVLAQTTHCLTQLMRSRVHGPLRRAKSQTSSKQLSTDPPSSFASPLPSYQPQRRKVFIENRNLIQVL